MPTKVSHARFYVLLSQIPQSNKEDLIWEYSNLTTTSLSEFYEKKPKEYQLMISDMQRLANEINSQKPVVSDSNILELKRLRSAILKRLQKYGLDTTDWSVVNSFMRQPKIAGKTLGEMSIPEMHDFIKKMGSILAKDKIKQAEIKRLSELN